MKFLLVLLGFAGLGAWLIPAAGRAVSRRVHRTEDTAVQTVQHLEGRATEQLADLSDRLIQSVEGALTGVGQVGSTSPLGPVDARSSVENHVPLLAPGGDGWPVTVPPIWAFPLPPPEYWPRHPLYSPWAPPFGPRFFQRMPPHRRRNK